MSSFFREFIYPTKPILQDMLGLSDKIRVDVFGAQARKYYEHEDIFGEETEISTKRFYW